MTRLTLADSLHRGYTMARAIAMERDRRPSKGKSRSKGTYGSKSMPSGLDFGSGPAGASGAAPPLDRLCHANFYNDFDDDFDDKDLK